MNTADGQQRQQERMGAAAVGRRVSVGTYRGTIRYVGAVPPTAGVWLGIEWDDPARGKHDGTAGDGTRYFDVRIPGSGTFVRPTASKLSYGSSFLEALEAKYLASPPRNASDQQQQEPPRFGVAAASAGTKPKHSRRNLAEMEIEAPNMDRVIQRTARIDKLRHVGLGGWRAGEELHSHANGSPRSGASKGAKGARRQHDVGQQYAEVALALDPRRGEQAGAIRQACPNVQWLDLSMSLLPSWYEVASVASELDRLECLILNFNRFGPVPRPAPPPHWASAFSGVKDLRLDGTLLTWEEMLALSPALPSLELLQLGQNRLTSLMPPTDAAHTYATATGTVAAVFPRLETLILEDNLLSSWDDVVAGLAVLPRLENLYLTKNLFSAIPGRPDGPQHGPTLLRLKHVGLCKNPIATWEDLDNLVTWFGTGDFSLNIIPLDQDSVDAGPTAPPNADRHASALVRSFSAHDFRAIAVARLARLETLDRTPVTHRERRDAELYVFGKVDEGSRLTIQGVGAAAAAVMSEAGWSSEAGARLTQGASDEAEVEGGEATLDLSLQQKRLLFPRYDELRRRFSPEAAVAEEQRPGKPADPATASTGAPVGNPSKDAAKGTLKAKLVEIRVTRSSQEPTADIGSAIADGTDAAGNAVKLVSSMPLRLAKIKLAKLAGARPVQVKSLWAIIGCGGGVKQQQQQGRGPNGERGGGGRLVVELDDMSKDLLWYSVGSGDQIVVVVEE